jgi:hypothetical protein
VQKRKPEAHPPYPEHSTATAEPTADCNHKTEKKLLKNAIQFEAVGLFTSVVILWFPASMH